MEAEILKAFSLVKGQIKEANLGVEINDSTFGEFYLPLISRYINEQSHRGGTYIIGFQGCQGIGKTTLTVLIEHILKELGFKVVRCSIDDYYCSFSERIELAKKHRFNPFYQISRGMPGTHRYSDLLNMLKCARKGESFTVPHFDKSLLGGKGDVTDEVKRFEGAQDFIILEGWCVGTTSVEPDIFIQSMKRNEYVRGIFETLDPAASSYLVVLEYLKEYEKIWELLDNKTLMLGEEISWILMWRMEQEERMMSIKEEGMSPELIQEFIKPYIPFTWLYYDPEMKTNSDSLLSIGHDHLPISLKI